MPEEITIVQQSISNQNSSSGAVSQGISRTSAILMLCAFGLVMSFFLPWVTLLGNSRSGFDVQKAAEGLQVHWLIPGLATLAVIAAFNGRGQRLPALLAGAMPFLAAAFWFNEVGPDLLKLLGYGAYLSLGFGAALILIAWRVK
jgi:hypothetical protein